MTEDRYNQDGTINENWLAVEITKREEGMKEVDIAQVKDTLKATLEILAGLTGSEISELLGRHKT